MVEEKEDGFLYSTWDFQTLKFVASPPHERWQRREMMPILEALYRLPSTTSRWMWDERAAITAHRSSLHLPPVHGFFPSIISSHSFMRPLTLCTTHRESPTWTGAAAAMSRIFTSEPGPSLLACSSKPET